MEMAVWQVRGLDKELQPVGGNEWEQYAGFM